MKRTIHHFEDEPELVQWIPGALLNRYWLEHPDWVRDNGEFHEDDEHQIVTFVVHPSNDEAVMIEYRVYRTRAEFDLFGEIARADDIVLVDIMGESPEDGTFEPYGLQVAALAERTVGRGSVFFLTAFPHRLLRDAELDAARIIAKPPDADALMSLLVTHLALDGVRS